MIKIIISMAIALLMACSPKLTPPEITPPNDYIYTNEISQDSLSSTISWWQNFGDKRLDSLMLKALAGNRDLKATLAKIESAREQLTIARAENLPSLSLEAYGLNEHFPADGTTQEYYIAPMISWEISLFGKSKSLKAGAKADLLNTEWSYRGVMLSLTAEVATTYYTLRQAEYNGYIARRSYSLRAQELALIDSLVRYGMRDGVALEQARSLAYQAKADIDKYNRLATTSHLALCSLIGENPTLYEEKTEYRDILCGNLPPEVPTGVPSDLLSRRPDILEAYYAMEKAGADVGLARAARLPSISLTGGGGLFATSLKGITGSEPWGWSAAATIIQPIFSFGALKSKEMAARAEYLSRVYLYQQSYIDALKEVESELISIESLSRELISASAVVAANEKVEQMVRALYRGGMNSYLNVVDAERGLYSAQQSYIDLATMQYMNYINLYKALGGGW
ncbi:MAG: efflux transporter outer membrane subunit [Rikenellaceae bacterium]